MNIELNLESCSFTKKDLVKLKKPQFLLFQLAFQCLYSLFKDSIIFRDCTQLHCNKQAKESPQNLPFYKNALKLFKQDSTNDDSASGIDIKLNAECSALHVTSSYYVQTDIDSLSCRSHVCVKEEEKDCKNDCVMRGN